MHDRPDSRILLVPRPADSITDNVHCCKVQVWLNHRVFSVNTCGEFPVSVEVVENRKRNVARMSRLHCPPVQGCWRLFFRVWGGCFLDYSVAARGAAHQADPVPGEPAGDVPLPELLGNTHTHKFL